MRKWRFIITCPVLCLVGCNFAPRHVQPSLPIATQYPDGSTEATALLPTWQDYFHDPRMRALIELALERNRDLAASVARIEQARAQYRIQQANLFPAIGINAGASRSRVAQTPTTAPYVYEQFSAAAGVSGFEFDFWGRLRNQSAAAKRKFLATAEATNAFRLTLMSTVASTYLSVLAGREGIALAKQTLARRQESLELAKLSYDAGVTSSIDYDQANLPVAQAQAQLADLQRTTAQNENQLIVLIGGPTDQALPQPVEINDQMVAADIQPGLPSALLLARPDIREAENQLRATEANIGVARAAFFPAISLTGTSGYASGSLSNLFNGPARTWSYGGDASLPVFNWGGQVANLRYAKAAREEAIANYQKAVQAAFADVANALAARQHYTEQIAAVSNQVQLYRRLSETARLRYDQGIEPYLQVLDAELNLFSAQQTLILLRATALANDVSLFVALGGGEKVTK